MVALALQNGVQSFLGSLQSLRGRLPGRADTSAAPHRFYHPCCVARECSSLEHERLDCVAKKKNSSKETGWEVKKKGNLCWILCDIKLWCIENSPEVVPQVPINLLLRRNVQRRYICINQSWREARFDQQNKRDMRPNRKHARSSRVNQ